MFYVLLIIGAFNNPSKPIAIASIYDTKIECLQKESEFKIVYPNDTIKCIEIKKEKE